MDLSAESGLRADIIRRLTSTATSRSEGSTASSSETVIRSVLVPANTFRQGEHFNIRGGGYMLDAGPAGNITIATYRTRFGPAATPLANPQLTGLQYNPGGAGVYLWYFDMTITHDTVPDGVGIGGHALFVGPSTIPSVYRGEISADFSIDNVFVLTANITGVTPIFVSETFQMYKVPSQVF